MSGRTRRSWLVTGATGFLGPHVVRAIRARGDSVVAIARGAVASPLRFDEEVERVDRDLSAARAFDGFAPELVVNVAAASRVGDCERDPAWAHAMNAELPVVLGAAFSGARLVHVSTDLVFGHQAVPEHGFAETDEPVPASVYGASKLEGERALASARPDAAIVRLPLLFGESFGRGLGASDALLEAWRRGERPRLFTDEFRTPLDVEAAASALVGLALGDFRGLVHVAGVERLSRYELGERVAARRFGDGGDHALHLEATTRVQLGLEDRPRDTSLDSRRWRDL